ncbi:MULTISPECIES: transposase [Streptomyces]|uniref:transposase n=1 Tax=Streptomyces TaxID=1883 RepID=UPI000B84CBF4|nr:MULTISPECIES: transposase [unclassified Streptomyces]
MADLPQSAVQSESNDVNRSRRPRPGAAALKQLTEVARDLGVSPEGLRGWAKQAKVDRGEGPAGALTSAEREELAQLRRKVRELEKTVDILGNATAFFEQDKMR